jgi:hypothetical protein
MSVCALFLLFLLGLNLVVGKSLCSPGKLVDKKKGVLITWVKVDNKVQFTLKFNATGWIGIGFSKNRHDMKHGDYLVVSADQSRARWFLSDQYNENNRNMPIHDPQQDGTIISASREGIQQSVVIERLINTGDLRDISFADANNILWGYGTGNSLMNEGTHFYLEHDADGYCANVAFV